MMAAVQPFLSGAISKTVNMPEEATVEDIEQIHIDSWKMGLKAVAIYRDNCKVAQPLSMAKKDGDKAGSSEAAAPKTVASPSEAADLAAGFVVKGAVRRKLPRVRTSKTYKFHVADLEGYFTVGEYEDGAPGEVFINVSKQGSTLSGLMDSFAISVSHGLQYGVPLKSYVNTLRGASFAPYGVTNDPDIRTASSITDYIVRRMALDYLSFDDRLELGLASLDDMPELQTSLIDEQAPVEAATTEASTPKTVADTSVTAAEPVSSPAISESPAIVTEEAKATAGDSTAPLCYNCGNQTQRAGSCYVCTSCGSTTGCS
jgi:ribonucleoside-diphosphate reductase alpha chain